MQFPKEKWYFQDVFFLNLGAEYLIQSGHLEES